MHIYFKGKVDFMYIGIDLGGTNIAVGIVNKDGEILSSASRPTLSGRNYSEIILDMIELCHEVTQSAGFSVSDIESIGVGSRGAIDSKNGVILCDNTLGLKDFPLAQEIRKHFDVPVLIENDANAAAYGEYCINGDGKDSFIAVTLGTGVGGGIIIDKKIYRGFNSAAGELGHMALVHKGNPCPCGNFGCWETYASVTALIKQTKAAIENHPDTLMSNDEEINGKTSFVAAKKGDPVAQEVVRQYLEYVAAGITSIVNIFQPDVIVISGGISKEGDTLLNPIKEYVSKYSYNNGFPLPEIKIATLKNDAGIIGAALASAQ